MNETKTDAPQVGGRTREEWSDEDSLDNVTSVAWGALISAAFAPTPSAEWVRGAEAMREAAAKACRGCYGKGKRRQSCSYCGDSTFDHVCDDDEIDCTYCAPIRALPLPTPDNRRYRITVREVGTCTRCGCEAEVRQPGRPNEFSCIGALACCPCAGEPACVVER